MREFVYDATEGQSLIGKTVRVGNDEFPSFNATVTGYRAPDRQRAVEERYTLVDRNGHRVSAIRSALTVVES